MRIPRRTGTASGSFARRETSRARGPRPINYYDILAVPPSASVEEIRAAYRERIAQYHPDRHPSAHAHAIAALINAAWEVLRDRTRRRLYDATIGASESLEPGVSQASQPEAPSVNKPLLAETDANRRASTRLKTLITTWVKTSGRVRTEFSATSTCVDLSVNGMAFTLKRTLKVGSSLTALLELPGGSINVVATVVRCEPLKRSGRWKIAAAFDDLREHGRQRVAEYLEVESRRRLD